MFWKYFLFEQLYMENMDILLGLCHSFYIGNYEIPVFVMFDLTFSMYISCASDQSSRSFCIRCAKSVACWWSTELLFLYGAKCICCFYELVHLRFNSSSWAQGNNLLRLRFLATDLTRLTFSTMPTVWDLGDRCLPKPQARITVVHR